MSAEHSEFLEKLRHVNIPKTIEANETGQLIEDNGNVRKRITPGNLQQALKKMERISNVETIVKTKKD